MANSSPEGIELGKGSKLLSMELSINKEKVLSIKQKETLEEAAEKYVNKKGNISTTELEDAIFKQGFIDGAKWQQQQNKNLYSDEDVQNLIKIIEWYDDNSDVRPNYDKVINGLTMFEWFEQFKKK